MMMETFLFYLKLKVFVVDADWVIRFQPKQKNRVSYGRDIHKKSFLLLFEIMGVTKYTFTKRQSKFLFSFLRY